MGSMSPVFTAASIVTGAYQGRYDAQTRILQDGLAADSLEAQAARKELEADEALKMGGLDQAEQTIAGRREIAELKTSYAAGGVKVNEGSAVDTAADKAAWSEYRRQKIEYEAGLESWGLKYDAALLRGEAANTRASAGSGGGAGSQSLLSAGGRLTGLLTT